ncbi:MAG: C39 family peptidase [Lentilactobacillus hilgardii]|uniref:C39 family peptidase n=1 Tax=Lentilactobacillus hilgardii TaxID=1588 RepID=UPI0039E7656D
MKKYITKKISIVALTFSFLSLLMFTQSAAASDNRTGYVYSPEISTANGGWNWVENGHPYTGFRFYMGTYYWFVNGVRQNAGWREAWGYKYYTDTDGRAVQGNYTIDGIVYNFGNNGTYYLRGGATGYLYTPNISMVNGGWNWIENGHPYTGFRFYMGTYYWFVNGVRQNAGWREAWGYKYYTDNNGRAVQGYYVINGVQYYFGNDGTYFLRDAPHAGEPYYYSQLDSRWASTIFNKHTFGSTGCVPTSLAMILKGVYGLNVTPRDVGNKFGQSTNYDGAAGSDLKRMTAAYGKTAINVDSINAMNVFLKKNIPLVILVNVPGGTHAIVATGCNNGLTHVLDPYNHALYKDGWYSIDGLFHNLSSDGLDWNAGTPVFAIK